MVISSISFLQLTELGRFHVGYSSTICLAQIHLDLDIWNVFSFSDNHSNLSDSRSVKDVFFAFHFLALIMLRPFRLVQHWSCLPVACRAISYGLCMIKMFRRTLMNISIIDEIEMLQLRWNRRLLRLIILLGTIGVAIFIVPKKRCSRRTQWGFLEAPDRERETMLSAWRKIWKHRGGSGALKLHCSSFWDGFSFHSLSERILIRKTAMVGIPLNAWASWII